MLSILSITHILENKMWGVIEGFQGSPPKYTWAAQIWEPQSPPHGLSCLHVVPPLFYDYLRSRLHVKLASPCWNLLSIFQAALVQQRRP